ncbi:hypothetical protein BC936DRAFT_150101 [Jimgerdemannia flammicorona]|uniref:Uncharacterized protein n=1 Tax=Jimgerdemannia flammicorona TaxID=994334 RepID=A0A433CZH3_9FUNG|nr:hypothetical protein BC936DRAFT_150101 [Jimgerdemannia flammicorona]
MALQPMGNLQHYTLQRTDPPTTIELRDKFTSVLIYTKVRHKVPGAYAISIVEPDSGAVMAEMQAQSSASKEKAIVLHNPDLLVHLKETGGVVKGFEWSFGWEGEMYRWVRELPFSSNLECRCIRKPVRRSHLGILTIHFYNMDRYKVSDRKGLEIAAIASLMTFFDRIDDEGIDKKKTEGFRLGEESAGAAREEMEKLEKKEEEKRRRKEKKEENLTKKFLEKEGEVTVGTDAKIGTSPPGRNKRHSFFPIKQMTPDVSVSATSDPSSFISFQNPFARSSRLQIDEPPPLPPRDVAISAPPPTPPRRVSPSTLSNRTGPRLE